MGDVDFITPRANPISSRHTRKISYSKSHKAPTYLPPFSDHYAPRRASLPPLVIPNQPSRRPRPVPIQPQNRSMSQPNISPGTGSHFMNHLTFQNSPLLPPSFPTSSPTPSTAAPSPYERRPLSYQPTPVEFKARQFETRESQQYHIHQSYFQLQPRHPGTEQPTPGNKLAEPAIHPDDFRSHCQSSNLNRTRVPPRLARRRIGPSVATFEARQRAAMRQLIEAFASAGWSADENMNRNVVPPAGQECHRDVEDQGSRIVGDGVLIRTGDRRQRARAVFVGGDARADGMGTTAMVLEEEGRELQARGLKKVSAEEYCEDVGLFRWMVFD